MLPEQEKSAEKSFPELWKEVLAENLKKKKELLWRLGIAEGTVYKWGLGITSPSLEHLLQAIDFLALEGDKAKALLLAHNAGETYKSAQRVLALCS